MQEQQTPQPTLPTRAQLEQAAQELRELAEARRREAQTAHAAHQLLVRYLARATDGAPERNAEALRRALGMVGERVRISEY